MTLWTTWHSHAPHVCCINKWPKLWQQSPIAEHARLLFRVLTRFWMTYKDTGKMCFGTFKWEFNNSRELDFKEFLCYGWVSYQKTTSTSMKVKFLNVWLKQLHCDHVVLRATIKQTFENRNTFSRLEVWLLDVWLLRPWDRYRTNHGYTDHMTPYILFDLMFLNKFESRSCMQFTLDDSH